MNTWQLIANFGCVLIGFLLGVAAERGASIKRCDNCGTPDATCAELNKVNRGACCFQCTHGRS